MKKKKYNVFSNVAFMVNRAWHSGRRALPTCLALALLTVGGAVAQMLVAPMILQVIESGGSLGQLLGRIGFFVLLLIVTKGGSGYLKMNSLFFYVTVRTDIMLALDRKRSITSYPNLLSTKFLEFSSQAIQATNGNRAATEAIWDTLSALTANVLGFGIYLALLSGLNFWLAAATTVISVLGFFFSLRMNRWAFDHREEEAQAEEALKYGVNLLSDRKYAKDLRIFGMQQWVEALWRKSYRLYSDFLRKKENHLLWAELADAVLSLQRNGLAYFVLISTALRGEITAAEFLLYFSAVTGFTAWVTGILQQCSTLHRQSIELSKLREFLDWEEPFRFEGGKPLPAAPYEFRLEDVSFRYPEADHDTISHLSLTLHAGEKLAIVGLNGAGKTTFIKLLAGFLDPTQGRVTLNGIDVREFDRRDYYTLFAAVFQDFSILAATVRENVTQSCDDCDEEKLRWSLEEAGLWERMQRLPQKLETQVTRELYEDGVEFSGGETQRLMLARVLYRGSPALLLDEPTAALDPIAENEIYQKYNEMTAGKTAVFISHRLASTRFCDRIVYFENGQIAEEGTHDALMQQGGKYAELFAVQSKYYQEDAENG